MIQAPITQAATALPMIVGEKLATKGTSSPSFAINVEIPAAVVTKATAAHAQVLPVIFWFPKSIHSVDVTNSWLAAVRTARIDISADSPEHVKGNGAGSCAAILSATSVETWPTTYFRVDTRPPSAKIRGSNLPTARFAQLDPRTSENVKLSSENRAPACAGVG